MALLPRTDAQTRERVVAVLCVAASLTVWTGVKLSRTYVTEVGVSLRYRLPAGITFGSPPPASVVAAVAGSGWQLLGYHLGRGVGDVVVDSAHLRLGSEEPVAVAGEVERAFATTSLAVRRVTPERIRPITSQVASARLPVRLRAAVHYAESYAETEPPALSPDTVVATGPASLLAGLSEWVTDSVAITDVRESRERDLSLRREPAVRLDPAAVTVRLRGQQVAERSFSVPVLLVGVSPGDSVVALPSAVTVVAAVGLSAYERLAATEFSATVDVSGVSFAGAPPRRAVRLRGLPPGVRDAVVRPGAVSLYRVSATPSEF